MTQTILILDFGSQYTQLIARKIRELNVYCEIHPYNQMPVINSGIKGVVLSGSPFSVRDRNAPNPDLSPIKGKIPILGICYGAQLLSQQSGGDVLPSGQREYGRAKLSFIDNSDPLFKGITLNTQVWMSHGDTIVRVPENFRVTASTDSVRVGGFHMVGEDTYGIQFHPEVFHTFEGKDLLQNFVTEICGCRQTWTPDSFIETKVSELKSLIGQDRVVLGLSGGVDSTVAGVLLNLAIGDRLTGVFIDNGLLRKNEFVNVLKSYKHLGLNVLGVDARKEFLGQLAGLNDPESKRKAIGRCFIEIFDREAEKLSGIKWLAQGTIYPDVIESTSVNGPSATIKSHHNVGGLPEKMSLKIVEPLKLLFKDEVRRVGAALHIPDLFLKRHPFPGPGLAIRILGPVTQNKVELLQEVDDIYIQGLIEHGLYDQVWQAAAILLPVQAVGVMGDERTYENVVALRAVTSTDGMTADWARLPGEFLAAISNEIINKVKGVNRVVYDISSKPPATIEWE